MNLHIIFLIFILIISLQSLGAFYQIRNFKRIIKEMKKGNNLAIGGRKKLFNSEYVIVACDSNGAILDSRVLNGMSIFNRFKINDEIIGKNIITLLDYYKNSVNNKNGRYHAYIQALTLLKNKLNV